MIEEQLIMKDLLKGISREDYDRVTTQLGANRPITKEEAICKLEDNLVNSLEKSLETDELGTKKFFLNNRQKTNSQELQIEIKMVV